MIRAINANNGGEIRQLHSGYNNIFLGGNGLLILGEEEKDGLEGAKMFLHNKIWKKGDRKEIDNFIERKGINDDKPSVIGLECFDHIPKTSNRIHHFH